MSDIQVTVTNPGSAGVQAVSGDSFTASVGNGGSVAVSTDAVSSGTPSVVSGTVEIGTVTTLAPGSNATVTNAGTGYHAILDIGLPRGATGATGPANSLAIGTVTTGAEGSTATATITGTAPNQTLSLSIPRGNTGPANSLAIGTVTTGAAGSTATATITGTAPNQTLSLAIPRGDTGLTGATGATGPANSLSVGTVTTGAAGSSATATITGTAPNQTISFSIPRGDTGLTGATGSTGAAGAAATISVGTVTTGAAGSNASVTNAGSSSAAVLNFTIPRGDAGTNGTNGSNGTNGREVELQVTATHVQWRYVGDSTWNNLVALSAITGPQGPQGPATIAIGTVTTGAAGSSATVTNSGTSSNVVLDFSIPQGAGGTAGVSWQSVPMSPSASGTNGDIAYDASFLYVKSASGWRRTAIATWTPLGAPTSVSAYARNAQATVSWTAPVDNGGYAITDYAVQYSSNGGTSWTTFADGTSTATTATVTGLTNDTAYVFRVAAINGAGTGPYSSATSSVTPGGAANDPNFSSVSLLLHMDGSGNTFVDSSGTPKTVTAVGNATQSTAQSKFGGKSASFSSGLLAVDDSAVNFGSLDCTVECWFYSVGYSEWQQVVSWRSSGGTASFAINGESWNWHFGKLSGSVTANTWHHLAIVQSNGTLAIYLDGSFVGSTTASGDFSVGPLTLGAVSVNGGEYFQGYIDELRVTKGVARYTANFTPPTAPFPDA